MNTAELIYQREVLLLDLKDHLALAGDRLDGPAAVKLADLYAFSHEALAHVGNAAKMYPGDSGRGALLQDYAVKVRADILCLDEATGGQAARAQAARAAEGPGGGAPAELAQHKVRLAAELVLESVAREAAAYNKMLARRPPHARAQRA